MKVFAYAQCGKSKVVSEDTTIIQDSQLKAGYINLTADCNRIGIADGVGGNAGGRDASEFVTAHCSEISLNNAIADAKSINRNLISYAATIPGKEKMATTFSLLLFDTDLYTKIVHVGNTRVYAIQGEYIKPLTRDHTTVEWLKARGDYEAAEAAPKNEITSCFGAGNDQQISQLQLIDVDRRYSGYLLTSDGVHDYLQDEDLEDFLSAGDFSEKAFCDLFSLACQNGSTDDKSMAIIIVKD